MITKARVTSGYAIKLPAVKDREFAFSKGLNILFGPNGCGKSSIINIIGGHSGTRAGWSRFLDPVIWEDQKTTYPQRFRECSPGKSEAIVQWDGTASFLMSPDTGSPRGNSIDDSEDGLMSFELVVSEMMAKASSGQARVLRLNRLFDVCKNPPDLTKRPEKYENVNDIWQDAMTDFIGYVKTLPREGPITLLLDEVDRSLSIPSQAVFWNEVIPKLAGKFQIIVATHCPFALRHQDALIGMTEGYIEDCRKALAGIVAQEVRS